MDLNKYLNNAAPSEPQYSKEDYAAMKKTDAVDDALTRLLHAHTPLFIW